MKSNLCSGINRVYRLTVDRERTTSFMGEELSVYSTPRLVQDIEQSCRDLLLEYSDVGEDSVGMEISLQHLAPTLLGMSVEIAVQAQLPIDVIDQPHIELLICADAIAEVEIRTGSVAQ